MEDQKRYKNYGSHIVLTPKIDNDVNLCVSNLTDFVIGCWNVQVIKEIFVEEEQKVVMNISLSSTWPVYIKFWWPTSDELFLVRSTY